MTDAIRLIDRRMSRDIEAFESLDKNLAHISPADRERVMRMRAKAERRG